MSESYPILPGGGHSPQSIYQEYGVGHVDQDQGPAGFHKVGTRAELEDGRVFYYASNGAVALTAGTLLSVPATIGLNITATDDKIILTDSFANMAVGVKEFVLQESDVETADIIQNAYAEGWVYVNQATGEGHDYKIRGHDSFNFGGTSTAKRIRLYDPVKVAAVNTTEISLCKNPYSRVLTSTTAEEEAPLGVAKFLVTASGAAPTDEGATEADITTYFFWAQTWGPCNVEVDDTTVAAGIALMSANTADRVEARAGGTHTSNATTLAGMDRAQIGIGLVSAAAAGGDFVMVDLQIRA